MTDSLKNLICSLPGFDPFRDSEGYRFDEELALETIMFWEKYITHIEGEGIEGQPYLLQNHEAAIIANIFGWVSIKTGYRRFRECFYYVPRKNSKTTFAAGLMVVIMCRDKAWRMQLYSGAADADQAAIIYNIMVAMIEGNPELSARFKISRSPLKITLRKDQSSFRPLSSVARTKHGKNAHAVCYDETHAFQNEELIEALHTSMAMRRQGLEIHTTTADHIRESVCNRRYDYASRVRDGVIRDPRMLPVIYEVPEAVTKTAPDYWKKEKYWRMANPLYGQTVQADYFESEVKQAEIDPHKLASFLRLHLNVRTQKFDRMIDMVKWSLNDGDYSKADFLGQTAVGAALDLGMTSDLCSLCLLFGNSSEGFKAIWWHWIPEKAATAYEKSHGLPFKDWEKEGVVTITPGDEIDYDRILLELAGPEPGERDSKKAKVKGIGQQYVISIPKKGKRPEKGLAVDRLFQGAWLAQQLIKRGWVVEEFGQGFASMAAPVQDFLHFLARGLWGHGNNPIMRWQAGHVVAETNSTEDKKPSKKQSEDKIDGIVTAIMATGMAMRTELAMGHAYEDRGLRVLSAPDEAMIPKRGAKRHPVKLSAEDHEWLEGASADGELYGARFEQVFQRLGLSTWNYVVDVQSGQGCYLAWRMEDLRRPSNAIDVDADILDSVPMVKNVRIVRIG
jgi:phage terminase large subunit-like protein